MLLYLHTIVQNIVQKLLKLQFSFFKTKNLHLYHFLVSK